MRTERVCSCHDHHATILLLGRGGQTRLYLNDGSGWFSDVTSTHLPAVVDATSSLAVADVDRDGDPNIVFGNSSSQTPIRLCMNGGHGVFTDAYAGFVSTTVASARAIALADVDGDADPDLALGMAGATPWSPAPAELLQNLNRQLDVPAPVRVGQPFVVEVHVRNTPSGSVDLALLCLSTTRVSIPIPPLGTLGILPELPLGYAPVASTLGVATFAGTVPYLPTLVGLDVHAQALVVSTGTADRLTNVASQVVAP